MAVQNHRFHEASLVPPHHQSHWTRRHSAIKGSSLALDALLMLWLRLELAPLWHSFVGPRSWGWRSCFPARGPGWWGPPGTREMQRGAQPTERWAGHQKTVAGSPLPLFSPSSMILTSPERFCLVRETCIWNFHIRLHDYESRGVRSALCCWF